MSQLGEKAFTVIPAGGSVKNKFDLAEIHDLSDGGEYVVSSQGTIPFADAKGNAVQGAIAYQSNKLQLDVDGDVASAVPKAISVKALGRRTTIDSSCTGDKLSGLQTALENAAQLATQASEAVAGDTSLMDEYYSTTDADTQKTVSQRFQDVADEASSTPGGGTTYHCDDPMDACSEGVLAWTLPSQNLVNNCDLYYSALPPLASECNAQDQATTSLHEFTHAAAVVQPPTEDYAYGYEASTSLPSDQAVQNADNYALLALSEFHLPGCTGLLTYYTYVLTNTHRQMFTSGAEPDTDGESYDNWPSGRVLS